MPSVDERGNAISAPLFSAFSVKLLLSAEPYRKNPLTNSTLCAILSKHSGVQVKYRGVEQLAARRAHNPEVVGSSPASATRKNTGFRKKSGVFLTFCHIFRGWHFAFGDNWGTVTLKLDPGMLFSNRFISNALAGLSINAFEYMSVVIESCAWKAVSQVFSHGGHIISFGQ